VVSQGNKSKARFNVLAARLSIYQTAQAFSKNVKTPFAD
jgi:hypothetical protein